MENPQNPQMGYIIGDPDEILGAPSFILPFEDDVGAINATSGDGTSLGGSDGTSSGATSGAAQPPPLCQPPPLWGLPFLTTNVKLENQMQDGGHIGIASLYWVPPAMGGGGPTARRTSEAERRDRRNALQRQYRAERKAKISVMEQELDKGRAEAEKLRQENAELQAQVTASESANSFWDELMTNISASAKAVRDTLANVVTAKPENIHAPYLSFLSSLTEPPESILVPYLTSLSFDELDKMTADFTRRRHALLQLWLSKPADRPKIESKLEKMLHTRNRGASILLRYRAKDTINIFVRRLIPPGADGQPHPHTYAIIEFIKLTPQQKSDLEVEWRRYLRRIVNAREAAACALKNVKATFIDPKLLCAASMCATLAAGGYLKLAESLELLQTYPVDEALALCDFTLFFHDNVLTPLQRIALMAATSPYMVDLVQLCTVLYADSEDNTNGGSSDSGAGTGATGIATDNAAATAKTGLPSMG